MGSFDATVNTVKAILGAGGFALPWAFAQGGIILTPTCLLISLVLSLYSMWLMIRAKTHMLEKGIDREKLSSYSMLCAAIFGKVGERIAEMLILSCCLGVCSAYLVFTGSTMYSLLPNMLSANQWVVGITPVMVLLSWLREMKGVSLISLMGTISVALGMGYVTYYCLAGGMAWAAAPLWVPEAFPKFFGSVAFLFFVHFTLPQIESAMETPKQYLPVSILAFSLCGVIGTLFGVIGAVGFGPSVSSVVVTMLEGSIAAVFVKILLCANLMCTFPIIVRSAFLIIEGWFESSGTQLATLPSRAIRTAFVSTACWAGVSIPSFGALIGLVGGISLTLITLFIPPLMVLKTEKNIKLIEKPALAAMMLIGAAILVMTLVTGG
mmetsp:Transcript_14458/g.47473  ORF Transcript_14458/g.47473 Transcript_14458/m.47473 type:complete len:380 (-) Transcript_14458:2111-3250(-)